MIKNRLNELLKERRMTITQLSKETGISRNTLTPLVKNSTEMIRFDTINKLCTTLRVSPNELLYYIPLDIDFYCLSSRIDFSIHASEVDPYAVDEYITINDVHIILQMITSHNNERSHGLLTCTIQQPISFPMFTSTIYTHGLEIDVLFSDDNYKKDYLHIISQYKTPGLKETIIKSLHKTILFHIINSIHEDSLERYPDMSDTLKEKLSATISEYVYVRNIKSDVFNPNLSY